MARPNHAGVHRHVETCKLAPDSRCTNMPLQHTDDNLFIRLTQMHGLVVLVGVILFVLALHVFHLYHVRPCRYLGDIRTARTIVAQTYNSSRDDISYLVHQATRHKCHLLLIEKGGATYVTPPSVEIHHVSNTGRDLGAFLWHVVTFYDTLEGQYIYTSANLGKHGRRRRLQYLLEHPEYTFHAPTTWAKDWMPRQRSSAHTFTVSAYLGDKLIPADVRPYKRWVEHYIGAYTDDQPSAFNGIFATYSSNLVTKDRAFYRRLLVQTEVGCNTEVVHFLERAVPLVFGPSIGPV